MAGIVPKARNILNNQSRRTSLLKASTGGTATLTGHLLDVFSSNGRTPRVKYSLEALNNDQHAGLQIFIQLLLYNPPFSSLLVLVEFSRKIITDPQGLPTLGGLPVAPELMHSSE